MEKISDRLKKARKDRGWTQAELAVAAGMSPTGISSIELGTRQAKGSLPQIAEALGVSHKWLAYGIEPEKQEMTTGKKWSFFAENLATVFDSIGMDPDTARKAYMNALGAISLAAAEPSLPTTPEPAPDGDPTKPYAAPRRRASAPKNRK